ncbi:T9SS type B sorting domain-containing protein [Flavobacteriaceae bacterium R38]|nr:T9SS type B sorting domain-containing protein [Flavobacteriaceae bacterium R38]
MRFISVFIFLIFFCFSNKTFAQNIPPTILVENEPFYCPLSRQNIVTAFDIIDPDDTEVEAFFIQISVGYDEGQDFLELTNSDFHPEIVAIWNSEEGRLTLEGVGGIMIDYDAIIAAVNDIVFFNTDPDNTTSKSFSYTIGDANFLPSTGHFYQFIPDIGISWIAAEQAASNLTFFGLQGYLATLTSAEEAQFAGNQITGNGWIGGSDAAEEGVWRWVTGPENGMVFWNGGVNGSTPNFANWNTGEPNQLGNEDYAHITSPGIGIDGSWNDLRNEGDPSGPFQSMGYVVEYGGLPGDPVINISASTTFMIPTILSVSNDINSCGPVEVDLTATINGERIFWFASETSDVILHTGIPFTVNVENTTTFWVLASVDGCLTGVRTPVTVMIDGLPSINNASLTQCDVDGVSDGSTVFNLNEARTALIGDITNVSIQFFTSLIDAQNATNAVNSNVFRNTVNPQTLFVRANDNVSACFSIAELVLDVSTTQVNNATLEVCDTDGNEDGLHLFTLSDADDEILNGLTNNGDFDIVYYASTEDALLEQNPLNNDYANVTPGNQIIYARIEDNNNCFGISQVNLIVNEIPILLNPEEDVVYCLNSFPETITLEGNIFNNDSENFSYRWSTGETTSSIEVNQIGVFTLEITNSSGCSNVRTITVLPSNVATIDEIIVNDVTSSNTATINVTGEGDYEFALDSLSGFFQDENTFNNISPGFHTVFVRDKNGCGVVSKLFSVIGFPRFFTPNGDSYNDTWQLSGVGNGFNENSLINIFDRFGKLIIQIDANGRGWDGTFNGNDLPASDYWFRVRLEDGRIFSGHFSLIR